MRSFASRNQLAADPRERAGQALEWDRHYVTVLGVANQRLYSFRLQTASDTYERAQARCTATGQVQLCFIFLLGHKHVQFEQEPKQQIAEATSRKDAQFGFSTPRCAPRRIACYV